MTQWWSSSRKVAEDVDRMHPAHAQRALDKLERGDYLDQTGNPPSAQDHITLRSALKRVIEGRPNVDPAAPPDEGPLAY